MQWWLRRAGDRPLDEIDWSDRSHTPHHIPRRTSTDTEDAVLNCRDELKKDSALGFFGAEAIREALAQQSSLPRLPSVRTIGRILLRRGALDGRRRVRRLPPPPGWYLPGLAQGRFELESYDVIEDLVIEGQGGVDVLTGRAFWGPHALAWPAPSISAKYVCERLEEHWRAHGLPDYAQFDNDTRFAGSQNRPDIIGRVTRFCLSLGVTPIYAPPRETGFQAEIERYNELWEEKVWQRFHVDGLAMLVSVSDRFTGAYERRLAGRTEHEPYRRPFPEGWELDLQAKLKGRIIYLRRTDGEGRAIILGQRFLIDSHWVHRLVRCEYQLTRGLIRCYGLRRREPAAQPLLTTLSHWLPERHFHE